MRSARSGHRRRLGYVLGVTIASLAAAGAVIGQSAPAGATPASGSDYTAGVQGTVFATTVVGSRIYVGGDFSYAGRWVGRGAAVNETTGRQGTLPLRAVGTIRTAVADGKGGWWIGGDFTQVGGRTRAGLARITSAGALATWAPAVTGSVRTLAVRNGIVYAGGQFTAVGGAARANLAALDSTGAVLPWNPGANGPVDSLVATGTGLLAGGEFTSVGGQARGGVAAVDAAGAVSTWNPDVTGAVRALALSPDGATAYLGGTFSAVGGQPRTGLAAVSAADGTVATWDPAPDGPVNALAVTGAGTRVLAGGDFGTAGGQARPHAAALSAATGLADGWNPAPDGAVADLDLASGGRVYLGGAFGSVGGQTRQRAALVDELTAAVAEWNPSLDAPVATVAKSGTQMFVGGDFSYLNGAARRNFVALDATTGDVDYSIQADTDGIVYALAGDAATGRLYVGGAFGTVGGQPHARLAALDLNAGGAVLPWKADADGNVRALLTSAGSLYVGGGFTNINTVYATRLARIPLATGAPDKLFKPKPSGVVRALVAPPDASAVLVIGEYQTIGGLSRNGAAAVNPVTGAVGPFTPGEGGSGLSAAMSPDGETLYWASHSNRLYAYAWRTANLPTWRVRTGGDIQAIAASATEIYVGGHFTNFPEAKLSRPFIASLYAATGAVTPWTPSSDGNFGVWAFTITPDSLLVGGDFTRSGGHRQPGFARYTGMP